MTLSLYVRVSYREPRDKYPKYTNIVVPYDDLAPFSGISRKISEEVEKWGALFGVSPFEWTLNNAYIGDLDIMRGAVHKKPSKYSRA